MPLSVQIEHGADNMNDAIIAVRAAVMLAAVLVAAPASAQDRYPYGREFSAYGGAYGYGPQVGYGAGVYGYEPGYNGYAFRDSDSVQRGFGQEPDRSPVGSDAWWGAMDRTGRGGQAE